MKDWRDGCENCGSAGCFGVCGVLGTLHEKASREALRLVLVASADGIERHGHALLAEDLRVIANRIVTEAYEKAGAGHTLACLLCGDTSRCVLTDDEMRFMERAKEAGTLRLPLSYVERLADRLGIKWSVVEPHAREAYKATNR